MSSSVLAFPHIQSLGARAVGALLIAFVVFCLQILPVAATASTDTPLLKTGISENVSPLAEDGSQNTVPEGQSVNLTMMVNLNSELTKVGDGVVAMVSIDSKNDGKTLLPSQWYVCGKVSEAQTRRRLGRDGYITVKFEKLVSPDGKFVVPIDVTASTKESTAKSVAKVVAKDSVYVTKGAMAGALLSVQMTGIPLAIASHGYSVAGGAAVGAGIGLFAALKRKGNVTSSLYGDELKFRIDKPVTLPAFNEQALAKRDEPKKIPDLDIVIPKYQFRADPTEDKLSKLLRVEFKVTNNTRREYCFNNFVIVSDHNRMYTPYPFPANLQELQKRVAPGQSQSGTITFHVSATKQKFWLVLLDRGNRDELARVPIN